MKFRRSKDDPKTSPVGSTPSSADSDGLGPADDRTQMVGRGRAPPDDAKTYFAPLRERDIGTNAGHIEPNSSRLPWPARDEPVAAKPGPEAAGRASVQTGAPSKTDAGAADPHTKLFARSAKTSDPDLQERSDPVVGWLVVVGGPGRGHSLELGIGANSIGRDPGQKVSLQFGDDEIHREKHALLVYDPRSRRYFLQAGEARNLTYVDDNLVLTPVELKGKEKVTIGRTDLRFVPLCGEDFDWS